MNVYGFSALLIIPHYLYSNIKYKNLQEIMAAFVSTKYEKPNNQTLIAICFAKDKQNLHQKLLK